METDFFEIAGILIWPLLLAILVVFDLFRRNKAARPSKPTAQPDLKMNMFPHDPTLSALHHPSGIDVLTSSMLVTVDVRLDEEMSSVPRHLEPSYNDPTMRS